jgi:hypothetical protein
MPFKFRARKSIKLAPGVKVNVNRKSVGLSLGGKYARRTVNTSGRKSTTFSLPGTGLSHQSTSTSKSTHQQVPPPGQVQYSEQPVLRRRHLSLPTLLLLVIGFCLIVGLCSTLAR